MQFTKYKFTKLFSIFLPTMYVIGVGVAILSQPFPGFGHPFVYLNIIFIIFLYLDLSFGSYTTIDQEKIEEVSFFIYKKQLLFRNIKEVNFNETLRALYILGILDNKNVMIKMSEVAFLIKDIKDVTKKLQSANPSIQFNVNALKLIQND